jgi:hypothetical protein
MYLKKKRQLHKTRNNIEFVLVTRELKLRARESDLHRKYGPICYRETIEPTAEGVPLKQQY